jgi:delta24-sterol reductase
LFHAVPWSYGTLGFLVAAELKMVRCKKYVRLQYLPCQTKEEFVRVFTEKSTEKNPAEFVEGLAYSADSGVVMIGTYTDAPAAGEKVNNLTLWYKSWFYEHVKKYLSRNQQAVECIPLRAYYHRHTRGIFWQMEEILPFGNEPWFRVLLGWVYPIRISLLKLSTPQHLHKFYENRFICQDMLVPINNLAESLLCFNEHTGIYPLWLCPHRLYREPHQGMIYPAKDVKVGDYQMFVDIGAYGFSPIPGLRAPIAVRSVEKFVKSVNGFQMLYADTYMTRDEFWSMFDQSLYSKMRKEMDAEIAFPDVYEKVKKETKK